MKFAAIDIGSNAIRLLLCNVYETPDGVQFKKAELVRMPLRLGDDAFRLGYITEEKTSQLAKSLMAFRLLIEVFGATDYRACATAAMREAKNRNEVIGYVKQQSDITIEVIDGKTEAQIIYSNHIEELLDQGESYLYIDVGGGSTELTIFSDREILCSQSFNIGTIRLLHKQVEEKTWDEIKNWIRKYADGLPIAAAIGSGGNINKLWKMADKKDHKPLTYDKLKEMYDFLKAYSIEDRIAIAGLNPDRADVIVPAAEVFLTVMKTAGINKIVVPQIGLADGIIHLLYEKSRMTV